MGGSFPAGMLCHAALQAESRTIPIVFAWVSDPIGSGFVSHPGGNITGFLNIETSVVGKWLTLMREIAPQVSRIGFLYNPQTAPFAGYYLDTFRAASPSLAIEAIDAPVHSTEEVEAFMTKLGGEAGAGLFVMSDIRSQIDQWSPGRPTPPICFSRPLIRPMLAPEPTERVA
jgi:putative ABC transport system substrate-binding protein